MTLKEFTEKYNVPYSVAYNATYNVKYYTTMRKDREYDEQELHAEAVRQTEDKICRYGDLLERQIEILDKLNGD